MAMSTRSRRSLILLLLVAVGAGSLAGAYALRQALRVRRAEAALIAGLEHYKAQRWPEAVENLSLAASSPPGRTDPEVLYAFADSRRRVPTENFRHLAHARFIAQSAHELAPDDPRPLRLLSDLYAVMGYPRERLDVSEKLLAIAPDDRDAHQAKFNALLGLNDDERALETAKIMVELFPADAAVHRNLMVAMARSEADPSELLLYAGDLSEANPESAEFAVLHLQAAFVARDQDLVQSIAESLPELLVSSPASLRSIVSSMDLRVPPSYISTIIDNYAGIDEFEPEVTILKADRAWKASRADVATELLAPVLETREAAPSKALALDVILNRFTLAQESWAESLAELQRRDDEEALSWRAVIDVFDALDRNEPDEALQIERNLIELLPATDEYFLFARAKSYEALGDRDRAIRSLERALLSEPRWMLARQTYIDLLRADANFVDALRQAGINISQFPNDTRAIISFLHATVDATENGDASTVEHERGINILDDLEAGDYLTGTTQLIRARLLAALNRPLEARTALEQYFERELRPSSAEYAQLIQLVDRLGFDDLQPQVEAIGTEVEPSPAVLYARARAAADDGRRDEGESLLRDAVSTSEGGEHVAYRRALARYLDYIDDDEGLEIVMQIAAEFPKNIDLQEDVLRLDRAWTDEQNVAGPISRIRDALTENSALWKLYDARRTLTFSPTEQDTATTAVQLEDLVARDPANAEAYAMLADAYVRLGDVARAADSLARAVDLNRDRPSLYPPLIRLYQRAGRVDEATRRLDEFVALGDVSDRLRLQRAELLVFQAMWDEAEVDLTVLASTGDPDDQLRLAQYMIRRGRDTEADALLGQMLAGDPTAGVIELAATFFVSQGQLDRGLELVESRRGQLPALQLDVLLAKLHEQAGDREEAEFRFKQASASTNQADVWAELAMFYVRQGDMDKANDALASGRNAEGPSENLSRVEALIDPTASSASGTVTPELTMLLQARAKAPAPGDDSNDFLAALRAVTTAHPNYMRAWQERATALIQYGSPGDAVDVARSAVRFNPGSASAARLLTEALVQAGRDAEALSAAERWSELVGSRRFGVDTLVAQLHMRLGQTDRAFALLAPHDQRMRREGGAPLQTYAFALASTERLAELRILINDSALTSDARKVVFLAAGGGLIQAGRADQTRALLESPPDGLPMDEPGFQMALGGLWFEVAQRTSSPDSVERAIALIEPLTSDPDLRTSALAMLGNCFDHVGRLDDAEAAYRQFLDLVPDQPLILNNLAYLLVKADRADSEAIDFARRAVDLAEQSDFPLPERMSFIDTLGSVYLKAGDATGAEQTFRDGLVLGPDNPELILGLAKSLLLQRGDGDVEAEIRDLITRFRAIQVRQRVHAPYVDEMNELEAALDAPPGS